MGEPLDARSDIFSLGAMFYELLTGRKWFAPAGEVLPSAEILKRVVEAEPRPVQEFVPDLRDAVGAVVHQALNKDRTRRHQSAADFVNGLLPAKAVPLGLLTGDTVDAVAVTSAPPLGFSWFGARQGSVDETQAAGVNDSHATAEVPAYLPQAIGRVSEFASLWDELAAAAYENKDRFATLAERLIHGLVREAIGYRLCDQIPHFRGTVGFMIEAPFLWIRQSRFPLLLVAFDSEHPDLLATVLNQLATAGTTEFFALLVVVPPRGATSGHEADELRRIVENSVYRHDFVVLDREHLASIVAHNSSSRLIDIIIDQVDDLSVLSPYVVRGPVPGQMFFGRESEIKTISQGLRRGDYAVVGGRRIGKSSILLRLKRLLGDDPRYHAIYLDCEAHFTDGDLFAAVPRTRRRPGRW